MQENEMEHQGLDELGGENHEMGAESPKEESHESGHEGGEGDSHGPLYVQKRLKQQQRSHQRQMQALRDEMMEMREQHSASAHNAPQGAPISPYVSPGQPIPEGIHPDIHKAVTYALGHRDMEERKRNEEEQQRHIARKYHDLSKHLDGMGDKYDDFDEKVRGDAPFTTHMRDVALMLPTKGAGSAGEVLYKLGNNPEELKRISKLHPSDQAAEMVRLSHALIGGEEKPRSEGHSALGQVKSNPINSSASITDKTSPGDIRRRMKAGTFK